MCVKSFKNTRVTPKNISSEEGITENFIELRHLGWSLSLEFGTYERVLNLAQDN